MNAWLRGMRVLICVFGILVTASPHARTQPEASRKAKWKSMGSFHHAVPQVLQTKIHNRILELTNLLMTHKGLYEYQDGFNKVVFARRCVLALALMQALPTLAEGAETNDQRKKFEDVKKLASQLVNEVRQKTLPEFDQRKTTPLRSLEQCRAVAIETTHQNYHVPILLMVLEFYFAGGLDVEPGKGISKTRDRSASPAFLPPLSAQIGIARLTAMLLHDGKNKSAPITPPTLTETKLNQGALWAYVRLGASPILTCMSKSGTVAMGLRAAVNLGLLEFDPKAFDFRMKTGGTPVTATIFRSRLIDVLTHAVVTITEPMATNKGESIGFEGEAAFAKSDRSAATGLPKDSIRKRVVDVRRYRTLYATSSDGSQLVQLGYRVQPSSDSAGVASYRYLGAGGSSHFGAYHAASAGYVSVTCSNILVLLLSQELTSPENSQRRVTGGIYAYHRSPNEKKWTVQQKNNVPRTLIASLDPSQPFTSLSIQIEGTDTTLPINKRIEQTLNMTLAMLCRSEPRGTGPQSRRVLDDSVKAGNQVKHWQVMLTTFNTASADGGSFRLNVFDCFGVMKACLATGHLDYLGPWAWYQNMATTLCDSPWVAMLDTKNLSAGANQYCNIEFAILTLSRSYRPLFPRSSKNP